MSTHFHGQAYRLRRIEREVRQDAPVILYARSQLLAGPGVDVGRRAEEIALGYLAGELEHFGTFAVPYTLHLGGVSPVVITGRDVLREVFFAAWSSECD